MKRLLMALLALMLMMSGACAEVFYNVALPEDWTERTVMTIVTFASFSRFQFILPPDADVRAVH